MHRFATFVGSLWLRLRPLLLLGEWQGVVLSAVVACVVAFGVGAPAQSQATRAVHAQSYTYARSVSVVVGSAEDDGGEGVAASLDREC